MTTPKATHQLQGSILAITPCEDSTFCVDNTLYITQINKKLEIQTSLQVTRDLEPPHRYSHAFGISNDSYFCIPIIGEKKSLILKLEH